MSAEHWNSIYKDKEIETLGWYQNVPEPDLQTILGLGLSTDDRLLIIGAGRTTLVDYLLDAGYENLVLTDISEVALDRITEQIEPEVETIVDDLRNPRRLGDIKPVRMWYDRAVLHFLTSERDRESYRKLLQEVVGGRGYVILAQFAMDSEDRCSGLDVYRYNLERMQHVVGEGFNLVRSFEHTYVMPSGAERPYLYGVFQRSE